ncbi:hypothetical protein F383_01898 [Gossypium arboreum]|uniref:Uncharacterized protein n=1 Tax=Gossypium arboreum TaxID=29729 RepID=A0A0B0PNQ9_GOSAR|nr:hypothetical protein F383_01898 [Gossypium arboreum]
MTLGYRDVITCKTMSGTLASIRYVFSC